MLILRYVRTSFNFLLAFLGANRDDGVSLLLHGRFPLDILRPKIRQKCKNVFIGVKLTLFWYHFSSMAFQGFKNTLHPNPKHLLLYSVS